MGERARIGSRRVLRVALFAVGTALLARPVLAHGGALRGVAADTLSVPTWLFLLTGGGAIGASFLLASFVTDRAFIRSIHEWHRAPAIPVLDSLVTLARAAGVVVLALVLCFGFLDPTNDYVTNLAVLVVWVGWWSGYTITVYLLGNSWPALNPWRTLADLVPSRRRLRYPERLGSWPSVAGLLALIWLEVISPVGDRPRLLAAVVALYTVVTVVGAVAYGSDRWFSNVDPIARVFRYYGKVAPIRRTEAGLRVGVPGAELTEPDAIDSPVPEREEAVDGDEADVRRLDEVAFIVAVLWVTTYDGLVSTPLWADVARAVVGVGVPALLLYLVALLAGFGLFLWAYLVAARYARRTGRSFVPVDTIGRRFAPSLLPIAAGYHLAHFLGYFLSLSTVLAMVAADPVSPPEPVAIVLPGWFGGLELAFVLLGHLLAIWVAHAVAYDLFPGRLQAIESQYPFVLVMVVYTMISLWIVSQPSGSPPFV